MKPQLTEELLEELSSPAVFQRGYKYYENGSVREIKWDGEAYEALVEGSDDYVVKISFSQKGTPHFFCDCPYDLGGICKHCVAVGLTIINQPDTISKTDGKADKKAKKTRNIQAKEIIKQATNEQIADFLMKLFAENEDYLQQFEVFIKGELNIESQVDIDKLANSVKRKIEEMNVSYDNLLRNISDSHGRYYEEWEAFYNAFLEIAQKAISTETKLIESFLENGLNLDAFKTAIALYEAIMLFDEEKIDNEYEVVESIADEMKEIWSTIFQNLTCHFEKSNITDEILQSILSTFSERLKKNNSIYEDYYFKDFLMDFANQQNADFIQTEILPLLRQRNIIELQMKLAEVKQDKMNWLILAEQNYTQSREVATAYLDFLLQNKLKSKFIQIAKDVFSIWPKYSAELICEHLKYEENPELYYRVAHYLAKTSTQFTYFKTFKDIATETDLENLLIELEKSDEYKFYIQALEELKAFEKIRDYFDKSLNDNTEEQKFKTMLKPIINIYPQHCFEKLKEFTERYIPKKTYRSFYQKTASFLKWLAKIEDEKIKMEAQLWLREFLKKYPTRAALQDEFKKAGIIVKIE
jgi:uncharacterized Zn finger protein